MDRIFRNKETGEIVISAENGFMPINKLWEQVGTIDVKKLNPGPGFRGDVIIK